MNLQLPSLTEGHFNKQLNVGIIQAASEEGLVCAARKTR